MLTIDSEQKVLVHDSFALVTPIADEAGALLYNGQFQLDPSLRRLFLIDTLKQEPKLMQMVTIAVPSWNC